MNVLSVNANNRLSKFINDIPVEYDVLLVQEWARHGTDGDFTTALSKLLRIQLVPSQNIF